MTFERASSECNDIIIRLGRKRNRAEEAARMNGEAQSDHYDLVINEIKQIKHKFDSAANDYYQMHKSQNKPLNENGCYNLLIAIVKSWAEDYEKALSSKDEKRQERINNLSVEGDNLVRDTTVHRIERTYKQFVKTAHDHVGEIIEDTEKAKKRKDNNGYPHTDYYREEMRNRCPLCGNAMYAKRIKSDLYLVKCTNCYLSEIVKVGQ
jgi:uncharacterized protein YaaR (DUF327 family)